MIRVSEMQNATKTQNTNKSAKVKGLPEGHVLSGGGGDTADSIGLCRFNFAYITYSHIYTHRQ